MSESARIARMMAIIGHQPVMWVNAITLAHSRPYVEQAMQRWNKDLVAAYHRHSLMRVFDWAGRAEPKWFISDGIPNTTSGYVNRNRLTAHALVKALPNGEPSRTGCLVH
jgi:hypothetical protein